MEATRSDHTRNIAVVTTTVISYTIVRVATDALSWTNYIALPPAFAVGAFTWHLFEQELIESESLEEEISVSLPPPQPTLSEMFGPSKAAAGLWEVTNSPIWHENPSHNNLPMDGTTYIKMHPFGEKFVIICWPKPYDLEQIGNEWHVQDHGKYTTLDHAVAAVLAKQHAQKHAAKDTARDDAPARVNEYIAARLGLNDQAKVGWRSYLERIAQLFPFGQTASD